MAEPIVYIDRSEIRSGTLAELKEAIPNLVAFVEQREPQLISYSFHIDEEVSAMTVVAVHPDSRLVELHLQIGGPEFRKLRELIDLRLIEVFGEPSETVLTFSTKRPACSATRESSCTSERRGLRDSPLMRFSAHHGGVEICHEAAVKNATLRIARSLIGALLSAILCVS